MLVNVQYLSLQLTIVMTFEQTQENCYSLYTVSELFYVLRECYDKFNRVPCTCILLELVSRSSLSNKSYVIL